MSTLATTAPLPPIQTVLMVLICTVAVPMGCASSEEATPPDTRDTTEPQFTSLFDGESLQGWTGDPRFWRVEDGEIVGQTTTENPAPRNTFLILEGDPTGDFELRAEVRITGNNNSGIQYRSKRGEGFRVTGYQCDMHPNPPYNAMLYEEGGRGIVATHGLRIHIDEHGVKTNLEDATEPQPFAIDDWHEYTIIARGNRIEHRIGDHVTVVVVDDEKGKAAREGIIALQLHAGGAYEVRFRKIRFKRM